MIKIWDIPNKIRDLEHDGNKSDLRLFDEDRYNWGADNQRLYQKAEKELDKFIIRGKGYQIYFFYD